MHQFVFLADHLYGILSVSIIANVSSKIFDYFFKLQTNFLASIKALQHGTKNDLVYWLKYWVVFSLLTPIHYYAFNLLKLIPMHNVLKLLIGIWLYFPVGNGSEIIMHGYIIPMYKYFHIKIIDNFGAQLIDTLIKSIKAKNTNIDPISNIVADPPKELLSKAVDTDSQDKFPIGNSDTELIKVNLKENKSKKCFLKVSEISIFNVYFLFQPCLKIWLEEKACQD